MIGSVSQMINAEGRGGQARVTQKGERYPTPQFEGGILNMGLLTLLSSFFNAPGMMLKIFLAVFYLYILLSVKLNFKSYSNATSCTSKVLRF